MSAERMKKESRTDWKRVKAMQDEEIDLTDSPELDASFFKEAVPWPVHKKQITLRLDPDVLDFFKSKGRGYQTAINKILRRYVEAQKHHH